MPDIGSSDTGQFSECAIGIQVFAFLRDECRRLYIAKSSDDPYILLLRGFAADLVESRAPERIHRGDISHLNNLEAMI